MKKLLSTLATVVLFQYSFGVSLAYGDDCDPGYIYSTSCAGDSCSGGASCCEGATCNYDVFADADDQYIDFFCYPECDTSATPTGCECGDTCVSFPLDESGTDFWSACVPTGHSRTASENPDTSIRMKIFDEDYFGGAGLTQYEISIVSVDTMLSGDSIPNMFMAYGISVTTDLDDDGVEDDELIILNIVGQDGMEAQWILQIAIPGEKWAEGTLDGPQEQTASGETVLNYSATLLKATVAGTTFDQYWLKVVGLDGLVTIHNIEDTCISRGGGCRKSELSFDIDLAGLQAEIPF